MMPRLPGQQEVCPPKYSFSCFWHAHLSTRQHSNFLDTFGSNKRDEGSCTCTGMTHLCPTLWIECLRLSFNLYYSLFLSSDNWPVLWKQKSYWFSTVKVNSDFRKKKKQKNKTLWCLLWMVCGSSERWQWGDASASVWSQGGSIDTVVWALQQAAQQQTNCLWCNWGPGPLREAYISLYVEMFKEQWIPISGCKIVFGASPACSLLSKQWQKGLFQDGTCNSKALTGGRRNGM